MPSSVINSDDGVISGTSGLKSSGGDDGALAVQSNGTEVAKFKTTELVINDGGANYDFRVEGDTKANLFFVDASADAVGIGTNSPDYLLEIENTASSQDADLSIKSATNGTSNIFFGDSDAANRGRIAYSNNTDSLELFSAATKAAEFDSNQVFKFNSGYGSVATAYGCRAWVNFDGTGTPAIREDGNVSSITDNGTGDYTVNFTTAMPDANYVMVATGTDESSGPLMQVQQGTRATGSCAVGAINRNGTRADTAHFQTAFFR
jgi:hypothetical protein